MHQSDLTFLHKNSVYLNCDIQIHAIVNNK